MKIIRQNLPAITLFLILVLGFASTSTNSIKLQFQSSFEEQKGEADKYETVHKSGPSTPSDPPHNGHRPPGPGGPSPPPRGNAVLQRVELYVQSQSSREEKHVLISGPSPPEQPPHKGHQPPGPGGPPPPPRGNAVLERKELDVQSQSSRKEEEEEEKGEVNYMHVFMSGPSTPTEPPHNGRRSPGPGGPPPLSSRVGVLYMQPKIIPPPSRPARNHNIISPTPS